MSLADDLRKAKALIDTPEKWGKGRFFDPETRCFCALGAAREGAGGDVSIMGMPPDGYGRYQDVHLALYAALPVGFISVPRFNDAPSTTHADIMALFQRAIDAAESSPTDTGARK